MRRWFLQTIGMDEEMLTHLDEVVLAFQYPVLLWFGLAFVALAGWLIYRRQCRHLGSTRVALRVGLTVLRVLILLLLILILAGPYLKLDYRIEKKPVVAILLDHSESMNLPAGPFEKEADIIRIAHAAGYLTTDGKIDAAARKALNRIGRAKLAQSALQQNTNFFAAQWTRKYEPRFYTFAREPQRIKMDLARPEFPEPPTPGGDATHLGDAVARILDETGGHQIAGILLFSDGQNTGGQSPSEIAHRAARAGAPVFAIPCGAATTLRDIAIAEVFTSGLVSVGDLARVAVTVKSQGFDGRAVKVQLLDGETVLASKELILHDKEQQQVELTFEAKEPGTRYLTVNVPPLQEEPEYLRANNADVAYLRVSEEKIRILYVEGLPRWDFRFLKNAIRRDHGLGGKVRNEPDILLETELRRRPGAMSAALPATLDELAMYHTVILGDASPKLVDAKFINLLGEAVRDRGVGLIVMAGRLFMPHAYEESLTDLLPVRMHGRVAGAEAPVYRPFRMELSPDGVTHSTMRLYDDPERNQNVWARMPPYLWCAAVKSPAPAATVLAWNPDVGVRHGMLPLIACHYAGRGKVLFVGTDSTWLWRQDVGDRYFYKFWGQSIRFVARRDEAESKQDRLEVMPVRAQPGEKAQIELIAFTADTARAPRTEATLPVRVLGGNAMRTLALAADPAIKGRYAGTFIPEVPGDYRVVYNPGGDAPPLEASLRVIVAAEELREPNVNRAGLELIASGSGGKSVELPDLGTILPLLKGEAKLTAVHRESSVWDNWLTLALIALLYSIDVGLRRFTGLA